MTPRIRTLIDKLLWLCSSLYMCAKRRQDVVTGEALSFGIGQQPRDERVQASVAFTSWPGLRPRGADERADPSPGFEHAGALELAVHARDRVRIDAEIACELPNRR